MKSNLKALKAHLKTQAVLLKELKLQRKVRPNGYVEELWGVRLNFRAHHIVYCLLRGKTLEQVENRRIDYPPLADSYTERLLQKQMAAIQTKYQEIEIVEAIHV